MKNVAAPFRPAGCFCDLRYLIQLQRGYNHRDITEYILTVGGSSRIVSLHESFYQLRSICTSSKMCNSLFCWALWMCLCLSSLKLSNCISSQKEQRWGVGVALCQFHVKSTQNRTKFATKRQLKEDRGRVCSTRRIWRKSSSCDDGSTEHRNEWADLWQDEGWWRQLFQETGGMSACCGLYPPQGIAAGLNQAATFLWFYFIRSSRRGWMNGWVNLIISVEMLHGIAAATLEILKSKVDQRSFNRTDASLLDFSFFFCYTTDWKHSCRCADLRVSV